MNAALNNLAAILDEYFPEYTEVFKDLLGKASMHILAHLPFRGHYTAYGKKNWLKNRKQPAAGG